MELRTVAILLLMATIVVLTSAFGAYQDGIEKQKEHEFQIKKKGGKSGSRKENGTGFRNEIRNELNVNFQRF